jgi:hypothetical protein
MEKIKDNTQQIEKLKQLKEKQLPAHIQKSVDEKIKYIQKPLNK